jgi:hypothetical protein
MSPRHIAIAIAIASTLGGVAPALAADTLGGVGTADDNFRVYLSTDLIASPSELIFTKGDSWSNTAAFSNAALTAGQNVYLLVDAYNASGPAMFIADFSLTGTGFKFQNNSTSLSTDTIHWTVGQTDFATATGTPFSMGSNTPGLQIWGQRQGISSTAQAIWAYNADWANGQAGHAYFVTQLVSTVPEPSTYGLMAAGVLLLAARPRRRG